MIKLIIRKELKTKGHDKKRIKVGEILSPHFTQQNA